MSWIELGCIAILRKRATKVSGSFESSSFIIYLYSLELVLIGPITVGEQFGELLLEASCPLEIAALPQGHLQRVQSGLIGSVQFVGATKVVDRWLRLALMEVLGAQPILRHRIVRIRCDGMFECRERTCIFL